MLVQTSNGTSFSLGSFLGKGGEAEIFEAGPGLVAKIYKGPTHPDLTTSQEREAARIKIDGQEAKLTAFPKGTPPGVIAPRELLFAPKDGKFLGFTMDRVDGAELLLRYGKRSFREAGVSNQQATTILRALHTQVDGVHSKGIVIADANDLNVLVKGDGTFLIDADSFQYGKWISPMFTERFLDPLLTNGSMILAKPHNALSDWYAYLIMVMQTLLYVGPYGGIHRPSDPSKRSLPSERPLKRITIFHPDVVYPAPAVSLKVLPDNLLQLLEDVFVRDKRIVPPKELLNLTWKQCQCGQEHARATCPTCAYHTPSVVVTTVRGKVTCDRILTTSGPILTATTAFGRLQYLYHNGGALVREPALNASEERVVANHKLSPSDRYRIFNEDTLVAHGQILSILGKELIPVDLFENTPVFDASAAGVFTVSGGAIYRHGGIAPARIGDVIAGHTLVWVGPRFGFGFYRVATANDSFVFDAKGSVLRNFLKVPLPKGQLVDSTCLFTDDKCWFIFSTQQGGKLKNHCILLDNNGAVLATAEGDEGDGSWLGCLRAKTAISSGLIAVTDNGLVRVQQDSDKLVVATEFPDSQSFVHEGVTLHSSAKGIYVVDRKQIHLLSIKR